MTQEPAARRERLTTIEATCRLCWYFGMGEAMTTAQASQLTGYSMSGAIRLLKSISRYWPIYQEDDGLWQMVWKGESLA